MLKELLKKHYALDVLSFEKAAAGAGADTYFVQCAQGRFVVKLPFQNEMNDTEAEPRLCSFLLDKGISVCRFLQNSEGEYITAAENGRVFHVQWFIDGKVLEWNTAPKWLLHEMAAALGDIHTALKEYKGLPVGIGADFFRYMTPENALGSYKNSLKIAQEKGDRDIEEQLRFRMELIKHFPRYSFDLDRLTCTGTHGDYCIEQLICCEDRIKAVIDWTTACIHPAVWELMRSYVYAAPECADGVIDVSGLAEYFNAYMQRARLSAYDIGAAVELYYYQLAVCDYYAQYYACVDSSRAKFLRQAQHSTRLMRWFEQNADKAAQELLERLGSAVR